MKYSSRSRKTELEIWGGVEATVNRVHNTYFDQIKKSGHEYRVEDLELLKILTISKVRYPVLWERTAPESLDSIDWTWTDARLNRLKELNIDPIVGLVHHGSGPKYTNLLDPSFPEKLAEYARNVADRYPWITYYTPVNEPLTTARFSFLYELWYPHHKNDFKSFCAGLIHQYKAIVLSMQEIRKINPHAKLIQTEDLGKVYSTPELREQAEFDNIRRFITYDILSAKVTPEHPMWSYFIQHGITEKDLTFFLKNTTPPDIVGINYYVTSERFLDTRIDRYPVGSICQNNTTQYSDVEAVRVLKHHIGGPYRIMKEAWQRYHFPIAVTEAHIGCTREEQLRWLKEFWDAGIQLKSEGVDLRAVTTWGIFGIYDWDSLVTKDQGHYEPGAFDVRSTKPRPTAIATMVQELSNRKKFDHPAFSEPGWWRADNRHTYEPTSHYENDETTESKTISKIFHRKPLVIVGSTGTLGKEFIQACAIRNIPYVALSRKELNIIHPDVVQQILQSLNPWGVINAAGYVRVDDAESDKEMCFHVNTGGPLHIASVCQELKIPFMTFSSDLVFDGKKRKPYIESDIPNPLNMYGKSKVEAEKKILEIMPDAFIIRTSAFFGPTDQYNFATITLKNLLAGKTIYASKNQIVSPTYLLHLVNTAFDLFIDNEHGIWHLANKGAVSWKDFAILLAHAYGIRNYQIVSDEQTHPARRPQYSVLGSERAQLLPSLEEAIAEYIHHVKHNKKLEVQSPQQYIV